MFNTEQGVADILQLVLSNAFSWQKYWYIDQNYTYIAGEVPTDDD